MNQRYQELIKAMQAQNLSAIALNPGPTLRWLTGLDFHLMERPVLGLFEASGKAQILLPQLEKAKLNGLPFEIEAICFGDDPGTWQDVYTRALAPLSGRIDTIGVESTRIRFLELNLLQSALPKARVKDASAALSPLRMRKDAEELKRMRRAAIIAQEALLATLPTVRPGQSEKQIASELLVQLFRAGSDPELPFMPIVSSGPNSANPHASPSDRILNEGEFLLIDWGAGFEGYFSDITRTFTCGRPTEEMKRIAQLVYEANRAGREGGRAGMRAGDLDQMARKVIEDGGYGAQFFHRLGHGLGMEAHEAPFIFSGNPFVLEKNMTFTIEPGIYLEGNAGVRIEDDMYVNEAGTLTSLSDLPREVRPLEDFWS